MIWKNNRIFVFTIGADDGGRWSLVIGTPFCWQGSDAAPGKFITMKTGAAKSAAVKPVATEEHSIIRFAGSKAGVIPCCRGGSLYDNDL